MYRITNQTRGTLLATRAERARSFWARLRGLMFRADLPPGGGLVIEPNSSVHTFWMRFPIDVVFVDRQDRVVGLAANLPPNRPYAGARRARRTIELPAGTIAATQTQLGDRLHLEWVP
ncbi:DUF192 domain-containing protein [Kallotenue papyrolyticum]|uniref:DUF192 domain-containing protein n=1 Tax=Kallotenue papyrolyticum TaxID=1325125 RepID=UPI0004785750|nr:DUF192 domain-containing protein [Kallotenue papyrolyticum]